MISGSSRHQRKDRTAELAKCGVWLWERRYDGAHRNSSGRWIYGEGFHFSKTKGQK